MADKDKKRRKARHTSLVLPGESNEKAEPEMPPKDRLGRTVPTQEAVSGKPAAMQQSKSGLSPLEQAALEGQKQQQKEKKKTNKKAKKTALPQTKTAPAEAAGAEAEEELPENAILLPERKPRLSAVKQKKRRRRIRSLVFLAVVAAGFLFYISGLYLNLVMVLSNVGESMQVAVQRGDGFPMDFTISGYITAEPMEGGGFAVLGEKDMAVITASGKQMNRIQHGYMSPGITAGKSRVCVYSIGGTDYIVESRTQNVARRTTSQDILFAEMSPGGWLAMVTGTQYRATLEIYSPSYQEGAPDLVWSLTDARPVLAAFHSDNRTLALGALTTKNGALGSSINIVRVGKKDIEATIEVADARLLQAKFIKDGNLLVIYDRFIALYNMKGAELARYDFGTQKLRTADVSSGKAVLLFGTAEQDTGRLVLLDEKLVPKFTQTIENEQVPRVLGTADGVFLLLGQEVVAYTPEGVLAGSYITNGKPAGLVYGGQPLLITTSAVEPLNGLLKLGESKPEQSEDAASHPVSSETMQNDEHTSG